MKAFIFLVLGIFCLFGAISSFYVFIKLIWLKVSRPEVLKAHLELHRIVYDANKGNLSNTDKAILQDAIKVGMVGNGVFHIDASGSIVMPYYRTRKASELFWNGEYPTVASIDAELEEFIIRT